ncbi:MAG: polyhydroxyalkanoic acid system family protein [Rubrivivax sp.]
MADIEIHRKHRLGLAKARALAWQWAENLEQQFGGECTMVEGASSDTVEFVRPGVTGTLVVAADHFDLRAELGFLVRAFRASIEAEIVKNLDALVGTGAPKRPARPAAAAKKGGAAKPAAAPARKR